MGADHIGALEKSADFRLSLPWVGDARGVVTHGAGDFGEELGWRGYLLRRWEDRPHAAVWISSSGWGLFHLPWLFVSVGPTAL